jgi:SulP family sulfate permease
VLHGLLPFDKACIGQDVVAGITFAVLGIAEFMGYTKIIGTPSLARHDPGWST